MEKNNTLQLGITYGLMLGIGMAMVTLVPFMAGLKPEENQWLSVVGLVLMVAVIVMAILKQKSVGGGFIKFGQAFRLGMTVGAVAAIISAVYMVFHTTQLVPDFQETTLETARQAMETNNPELSEEQIDMALSMTAKFTTPVWMALFSFLSTLFPTLIFSLLVAAFLKKDPPPFLEENDAMDANV